MLLKPKFPSLRTSTRFLSTIKNTVDKEEINLFQTYSDLWWDEHGPLKPLHTFNKLRVPFIRDGLVNVGALDTEKSESPEPLKGLQILDLGCGGGILSEPLARLGGQVTGLDATIEAIQAATHHAAKNNIKINYVCQTIEDHSKDNLEKYDVIVASEILEHITEKDQFLDSTCQCLKPKGSLFVTTLSKTFLANILAVWMGEYLLKLVPEGTHQYEKFITPESLQKMLNRRNLNTMMVHGLSYNPITHQWSWFGDQSVNYALHAMKKCGKNEK